MGAGVGESRSPQSTSTETARCSPRPVGLVLPVLSHHTAVLARRRHYCNHRADRESLGSGRRRIIFGASCNLSFRRDADRKARSRKQAPRPNTAHDRGGLAAALDTRASAMGTIALAAFELLVWKLLPRHSDYGVVIAIA